MTQYIRLRRIDTSTPWGFRMNGGTEYGEPLYVQKVNGHSIAYKSGLRAGDGIMSIGRTPTLGISHQAAKMEIIRNGNELDFLVQRDMVPVEAPPEEGSPVRYGPVSGNPRTDVVIDDDPGQWAGPPQDPNIQSRSFRMLQQQLLTE